MIQKIKALRNEKTPDEIENLLLEGKLGNVWTRPDGYQYIGNILLSHLVIEAHRFGFIEWMKMYQGEYVVHHIDGNPLNNVYLNLQVMSRIDHPRMHTAKWWRDSENTDVIETRNKVISNWFNNPKNAEAIEAIGKAISESLIAYYTDPDNAEAIKTRNEAKIAYFANPANAKAIEAAGKIRSETRRKSWINLTVFKKLFTVSEYAEVSKINIATARARLRVLLSEGQITCEKILIRAKWCNVYSVVGAGKI